MVGAFRALTARLQMGIRMLILGLMLGDGVWEKFRLSAFLLRTRFVRREHSHVFRICANGAHLTVHIRDNFSDAFVLLEAFRSREYDTGLPPNMPNIIFDVGANVGFVTLYLKTRYPQAHIYCFEPDPESFMQLQRNVALLSGVTCFPFALGGKSGTRQLYRSPAFHMRHSLLPKDGSEHIPVDTITFIQALERATVSCVDLLKLDIEGGERELFENDFPFESVTRIVGELHPSAWPDGVYDRLVSRLRSRYTLQLHEEGRKVFFTASRAPDPSP